MPAEKHLWDAIRALEERIMDRLTRNAEISGQKPDKRAVEAAIEEERQSFRASDQEPMVKKALLAALDVVADRLRTKSWG